MSSAMSANRSHALCTRRVTHSKDEHGVRSPGRLS
eukprot:CAMPEP_0175830572 /NCGR_PEP_ID=MMETSP0107_2-20121207/14003_1 /TAXON_ID=195067 ORGANISM="Goniomonas pacifica, Strain CCMP1869" /NCGR_SAMPLE_ID=MMETSP0107_2 /ASSEMBLY_ACC=CAM_ASM_000203 /LENGTH=34 /DNA_ID= /DNA_START= /DNA_END= /DNA_ORIENTATION=